MGSALSSSGTSSCRPAATSPLPSGICPVASFDGASQTTTLYLAHQSAQQKAGEGEILSAENAELGCELTGVDRVAEFFEAARDRARVPVMETGAPFYPIALFQPSIWSFCAANRSSVESFHRDTYQRHHPDVQKQVTNVASL